MWLGGNRPHIRWGPKLIQEKEQPKTQPDTRNRHTLSHIPTLMHTHKNTHPRTQRKDKQQWTSYTHLHSPYIHTLYSQVQVPIPHRDNQPPDPMRWSPSLREWREGERPST
ncbi:hypothetical protein AMECASPLE_039689 [Ameca splendens]|uniref:Uncharacterized protein n=1 Tax=Ameca splendens TaxID=208324 RepID=A0ABV0YVM2_9TELE